MKFLEFIMTILPIIHPHFKTNWKKEVTRKVQFQIIREKKISNPKVSKIYKLYKI